MTLKRKKKIQYLFIDDVTVQRIYKKATTTDSDFFKVARYKVISRNLFLYIRNKQLAT